MAAEGICYFNLTENHSVPFFSIFSLYPEKYHIHRRQGRNSQAQIQHFNMKAKEEIVTRLKETQEGTTIISGEDFSLLQPSQISKLKEFLDRHFDEIQVIGYARPPVSFVNAYAMQALKGGKPLSDMDSKAIAPNYRWRFEKFIDTFGASDVHLKPYLSDELHNACIVADILQELGAPDALHSTLEINRTNRQFSMAAAQLLDRKNSLNPNRTSGGYVAADTQYQSILSGLKGTPFSLSPDQAATLLRDSDEDIAWMLEHFSTSHAYSHWDDRLTLLDGSYSENWNNAQVSATELTKLEARIKKQTGSVI